MKTAQERAMEQWEHVGPDVERVARAVFARVRCPQRRDDCLQEVRAYCWQWVLRLCERDREQCIFAPRLVWYALRRVRSRRPFVGSAKNGWLNLAFASAYHSYLIAVGAIWNTNGREADPMDHLPDAGVGEPSEVVAFREWWHKWQAGLPRTAARVCRMLAMGERTKDTAAACGVTPARVSQIRKEAYNAWREYYC